MGVTDCLGQLTSLHESPASYGAENCASVIMQLKRLLKSNARRSSEMSWFVMDFYIIDLHLPYT